MMAERAIAARNSHQTANATKPENCAIKKSQI
jgi:hypothetical protein